MKKIIFSLLVLLSVSSFSLTDLFSSEKSGNNKECSISLKTYNERVNINGVWYIIVYDEDGGVIDVYKDPIQD